MRPGLKLVAAADNRTFLEKLRPDERAVDFAREHLSEVSEPAVASDWYDKYPAILRDDERGRSSPPRQGDADAQGS